MDGDEILLLLIGIALLASPFIIGWAIWSLLAPVTVLERILSAFFVLFVCLIEGISAWFVGILMIAEAA